MPKTLDAIVADLVRETASHTSLEARVAVEQTSHIAIGPNPPRTGSKFEHYIETAAGDRYYRLKNCDADKVCPDDVGYRSAGRCARVAFKRVPRQAEQDVIVVTKTFMDEQMSGFRRCPFPLLLDHVGLIPLHEALPGALRAGTDRVIGRDCDVFIFRAIPVGSGTRDMVYHLDEATSIPLKVELFADEAGIRADSPQWTWEATALEEVQGFHVVLRSRYESYKGEHRSKPEMTEVQVIESLAFDKAYDAATFWPTYQPGVRINDLIARREYYNTPTGKAPARPTTSAEAGPPIVADAPADLSPWLTLAGVGVGGLLVGVGIVLWVRRR